MVTINVYINSCSSPFQGCLYFSSRSFVNFYLWKNDWLSCWLSELCNITHSWFSRYLKYVSICILWSTGRIQWTQHKVAHQPLEHILALRRGLSNTGLEPPIWARSCGKAATLSSGMDSSGVTLPLTCYQYVLYIWINRFPLNAPKVLIKCWISLTLMPKVASPHHTLH